MSDSIESKKKSVESINNTLQLLSASGQEKDKETGDGKKGNMSEKGHSDKGYTGNVATTIQKEKKTHPGITSKRIGKRHRRKMTGDPMKRVSGASIRRLFQRAGAVRIQAVAYNQAKKILREITDKVVNDSLEYMSLAGRKTINAADVVRAVKRRGDNIYGYP